MYPQLFQDNEWELFTGEIVGGISEGKSGGGKSSGSNRGSSRNFPDWAAPDRIGAFELLESNFPRFVSNLQFNDAEIWGRWSRSPECEKEFSKRLGRSKLSPFQKVLVIQALRPDRLQSAMVQFVCEVLDVSTLAPPPVALQRFYEEETKAETPILLIATTGADPSKDLQELASKTVGRERYCEVAMGGGQQRRAMKLLHDCAKSGDWLCLKNLHLVTAWLPELEKEISGLEAAEGFRLWLTTEPHPGFPLILLQTSIKLTFESPPGLKKNLQRTYELWDEDYIAKGSVQRAHLLYILAWFHAMMQERRTYMPQGWVKFYEFSLGDLRAGASVVELVTDSASRSRRSNEIDWQCVAGLLSLAGYGGRIDNNYDFKVLLVYLKQYFCRDVLNGSRSTRVAKRGFELPPGTTKRVDYLKHIESLPDTDSPTWFGLPLNVERSVQRARSSNVVRQLKKLAISSVSSDKFDREHWKIGLGPIVELWDKLVKSSKHVLSKPEAKGRGKSGGNRPEDISQRPPLQQFILMESQFAYETTVFVDGCIKALKRVIYGAGLLTPQIQNDASALLSGHVPARWEKRWEGPEQVQPWLRLLAVKKIALVKWQSGLSASDGMPSKDAYDLSDLFNPETFLMALRQQTARVANLPMDSLILMSSFSNELSSAPMIINIKGLLLQGASFTSGVLQESAVDASGLTSLPTCSMAFIKDDEARSMISRTESLSAPLYFAPSREKLLTCVQVPVSDSADEWICAGVALFLSQE